MAPIQLASKRCVVCHKATGPSDGESVLSNGRGRHGHAKCIRCTYLPPGEFLEELRRSVAVLFSKARDGAENLRVDADRILEEVAEYLLRLHENHEGFSWSRDNPGVAPPSVRLSLVPLAEKADSLRFCILELTKYASFRILQADVVAAAGRIVEVTREYLFFSLPLSPGERERRLPRSTSRIAEVSASM